MKVILYLMLGVLLSTVSSAQMVDSLSGLAIQGAMTQKSARQVGQGLSALKRNQILQDLVQTATNIRLTHMNGYAGVNAASVSGQPFDHLPWSVGSEGSAQFYIRLENVDLGTCRYLVSGMTDAREIEVNQTVGTANLCQSVNTLKFIFD